MSSVHSASQSINDQIYSCLDLDNPKSFFLFAGAGSGKTRSLVEVLKRFKNHHIHHLQLNGQKVAVITYTNAACDEIKRRLDFDSSFVVSTIHSFSWELIKPFQKDIKEWVKTNIHNELEELREKQSKGRAGTKAESDRAAKIESKEKRLQSLEAFKVFTYNPNGTNSRRDSLNHAEVIKIASDFLLNKLLMQQILVRKHPILLIDESQDTKKELIEAFFAIQKDHSTDFLLGLFGDTMQRIYTDGKLDLGIDIPDDWDKPVKEINYRSPKRVITLINKIRSNADDQKQVPYKNEEGVIRLFIINSNVELDKQAVEKAVSQQMATFTADDSWKDLDSEVKTLTLEHHMAARRSGFIDFFEPLYQSSSDSTGLLDGTMSGIPFLTNQLLPLIKAMQAEDKFTVAQIVKKYSPLLDKKVLKGCDNQIEQIKKADSAVESLMTLWREGSEPTLFATIKKVFELNLFLLPEHFLIIAKRIEEEFEDGETEEEQDMLIDAWDKALNSSFSQLERYSDYISDNSHFGTHQGIKGLEFPRVMVILDDEEARGFLFSYEKLFGATEPTATDKRNEDEGKETSIDRTRRLFYVACSRAEKSLAIVAYTKEPEKVYEYVLTQGWFGEDELIVDL
jgi:DNA helicase II / ATP-dependent DNA helicase PcrA